MNPYQSMNQESEPELQEQVPNGDPTAEVSAERNQVNNYAMVETHLQVSNLLKILFTIDYNLLRHIVENTPEELKVSKHFKILEATLVYFTTVGQINEE